MVIAKVDLAMLNKVYTHMHLAGVPYKFGGKAEDYAPGIPIQDIDSSVIKGIDCSGFTRYILAKSTGGALLLPDGSSEQHDWCRRYLNPIPYASVAGGPGLYIAFISPDPIGHVWLVRQNWTRESHGGVGVSSRLWDTPILKDNCSGCFILPTIAK